MSRNSVLVLVILALFVCGIGVLCGVAGWASYRFALRPTRATERPPEGMQPTVQAGPPIERARPTTEMDRAAEPSSTPSGTGAIPAPTVPPRRVGGTLRLLGGRPPTLDPAMVQDSTSAEYVVHIFSGLVVLNSQLQIVPDLASRWEVSQDGRIYTFYLIPEATFRDGKAIKAEDFVYSIERACSPRLASPVAESYLGDIVGVSEFAQGRADRIVGLKAVDDHTLQIQIDAPKSYFLAKLTYPTAFVVDRAQIEKDGRDWLRKPNTSGPFFLESASAERIVLVRNPRYAGQKASLERVEYNLGGGQPMTMYENDQLDVVDVSSSEIERVLDPDNPLNAEHRVGSELSVQYLAFNIKMPPFDDVAVRQAFAHAIDKSKLADLVLKGTAAPANGILPPGLPDFDPNFQGLPYDPQRARQLLASSRYADKSSMPEIVLSVSGSSAQLSPQTRAILSMIEQNLGIKVMVEQIEWSDFLEDLNEQRYQFFSGGWVGDYPDSQNFLDILFHSSSAQNHMGYRNEQVDKLLEQARIESDPAKRTSLYRQAERLIVNDAPWIPLTHGVTHVLVKPYVKGYAGGAAIYPWLKDIYLEK